MAELLKLSSSAVPTKTEPLAEGHEHTGFDVIINGGGIRKIEVMKVVRTRTGWGLREVKALVDTAPQPVAQGVSEEVAQQFKAELIDAGASVEVQARGPRTAGSSATRVGAAGATLLLGRPAVAIRIS